MERQRGCDQVVETLRRRREVGRAGIDEGRLVFDLICVVDGEQRMETGGAWAVGLFRRPV